MFSRILKYVDIRYQEFDVLIDTIIQIIFQGSQGMLHDFHSLLNESSKTFFRRNKIYSYSFNPDKIVNSL